MNHRETCLVPNRVIAPDFGNVDLVFCRQPFGDIDRTRRHIEMKGHPGPPEMRPLRHGFEVIHRLRRFHLDRAEKLVSLIW